MKNEAVSNQQQLRRCALKEDEINCGGPKIVC